MLRDFWLGIAFLALLSSAFGNWNDTSTGIDLDRLRQFKLTKIRAGQLASGSQTTFDGITANAGSAYVPEVRLSGTGKSERQWEAYLDNLDEVWRADLDGNGTPDYVLFSGGPYFNGRMTPLFSLSILLMDIQGMPVPFFTAVYRGENGGGTKHLVDLNNDGRAQLLISTYDEIPSDARVGPFCSGHWTTQLYRFNDLGAEEIRGTIAGIIFPFVHDWTYRGTLCDRQEKPFMAARPPTLYEHGTKSNGAAISTTLKSINAADDLQINPIATCTVISPRVVVYDTPKTRKIVFPNLHTTSSADLARTILHDKARVDLRGIDRWMGNGNCIVNLMWAK